MSSQTPTEALHHFRRQQAERFAQGTCDALVGDSPALQRVRAQVDAAAASGANTLVRGEHIEQLRQVAQAIHYRRHPQGEQGLLELDAQTALPSQLGRLLLQIAREERRGTLLIESIDRLAAEQQLELLTAMAHAEWNVQVLSTQESNQANMDTVDSEFAPPPVTGLSDELQAGISTMAIELPPLADRPEDVPALARWYLEDMVAGTDDMAPQLEQDALDLLLVYPWPRGLAEMRELLTTAAGRAKGGTITARHLPKIVHHALDSASLEVDRPEPINLDEYLSRVESALVERALELASGNKAEAARLLCVSRPRLYRKLEQMGLLESTATKVEPVETERLAISEMEEPAEETADDIEFHPVDPD